MDTMSTEDLELEEAFFPTNEALWLRRLPCLRLFRACWIAIDYRAILFTFGGLLLLGFGDALIDESLSYDAANFRWPESVVAVPRHDSDGKTFTDLLKRPLDYFEQIPGQGARVLWPVQEMVERGVTVVSRNRTTYSRFVYLIRLLWFLAVMAFIGLGVSRVAASELTGQASRSFTQTISFARQRFSAAYLGPLAAVIGVVMLWVPILLMGLLGRIPFVGDFLLALLWWFVAFLGFLLALLLVSLSVSWPMMVSAMAIEEADLFDGMSRGLSYLYNRFWHALFYVVIMILTGGVCLILLMSLLDLGAYLTHSGILIGKGSGHIGTHQSLSRNIGNFFAQLYGMMSMVFAVSYFWVSTTTIYLLLRKSVDGTALNVIVVDDAVSTDIPLSGIPAAVKREAELKAAQQDPNDDSAENSP